MRKPLNYLFYATLLDGFQGYLSSSEIYQKYWGSSANAVKTEEEFEKEQFNSFIDRINRVPFDSEAADRGSAFNEIIDCLIDRRNTDKMQVIVDVKADSIRALYNERVFSFSLAYCREFAKRFKGAVTQVRTEATLNTKYGDVGLYGYIDELMPFKVHDIKTTKKYSVFSFRNNWQHIVYPYCLNHNGVSINDFEYNVVEMNDSNKVTGEFVEFYSFVPERDIPLLTTHCERLIDFIELNRDKITDKKIFNQHDEENE